MSSFLHLFNPCLPGCMKERITFYDFEFLIRMKGAIANYITKLVPFNILISKVFLLCSSSAY